MKIMFERWPTRQPWVRRIGPVHIAVGRLWQYHLRLTPRTTLSVYRRKDD